MLKTTRELLIPGPAFYLLALNSETTANRTRSRRRRTLRKEVCKEEAGEGRKRRRRHRVEEGGALKSQKGWKKTE